MESKADPDAKKDADLKTVRSNTTRLSFRKPNNVKSAFSMHENKQSAPKRATKTSASGSEEEKGTKPQNSDQEDDQKGIIKKTVLENHGIILGKVIGSGTYAKVKIAYLEEKKIPVAVKIISKNKAPKTYTEKFLPRELEAVKGLHHENLIKFYQNIETSHRVYIVMQLAENGTLLDYIRKVDHLEESLARKLFLQLISAVGYCHLKGVVHRDIKLENILLDSQNNLKLIDFGFARSNMIPADDEAILSKTFCGSYAYASPEILRAIPYDPFKSDIWATGVVLYAMVIGRLPFSGNNTSETLKRMNAKLVFPRTPETSGKCKSLIAHILAPLKARYGVDQIKSHPWITESTSNLK